MTAAPPRRPWWKRKRTWAAAMLWLAAYPASVGPLKYLNHRRWLPARYWHFLYVPLNSVLGDRLGEAVGLHGYARWWAELGDRHAAVD